MSKYFGAKRHGKAFRYWLYSLLVLFAIGIGITLAFLFSDDFASGIMGVSGKVKITAVGRYGVSIADSDEKCNLELQLDRDYGVLIPNMPVTIWANCKVNRSTTKPLLRAGMDIVVLNDQGNKFEDMSGNDIPNDIYSQMMGVILDNTSWYYHTDGFFYYIDTVDNGDADNSILKEIDAGNSDTIVNFINGKTITIPQYIDDSYSGLSVKIKITFQAIQNYIPDDNGEKLPNTIKNSLKIFNEFKYSDYQIVSVNNFNVTTSANGNVSLSAKSGVNYPENMRLPEKTSDGKNITTISSNMFKGNATVKNIMIPSSYTTIAPNAFAESGIISVDASVSDITEIPTHAFEKSKITSIKFPSNLTKIGNYAFNNCTLLNNVEFPDSLLEIGVKAFNWCTNLTNMGKIPANVTTIGKEAFANVPLLKIVVDKNNQDFYDVDNIMLISKTGILKKYARSSLNTSLVIPDEVVENESLCLYGASNLKSITFGKNLQSLDGTTNLIPENVTEVNLGSNTHFSKITDEEDNVFLVQKSNKALVWGLLSGKSTTLVFPDEIKSFYYAIGPKRYRANIQKIVIGKSLTNLGSFGLYIFSGNKNFVVDSENTAFKTLTGKELLSADGTIMYGYAGGLKEEECVVPEGVKTIGPWTLSYCDFKTVSLPNSLVNIRYSNFVYTKKLESINIPSGVTMQNNCFTNCDSLTSISIDNVDISYNTFMDNKNLKNITIGAGINAIGQNFLNNCSALEWVEFKKTTPPTFSSGIMMQGTNNNFVIYVPDDSVDAYKTANNFTAFANRIRPVSEKK